MPWNWELSDWPHFQYDANRIVQQEKKFFLSIGNAFAFLKNLSQQEHKKFAIEILCTEGLKSSEIEGEILDRESLQSSIRQQFGLNTALKKGTKNESQMAKILVDVYDTFEKPLTHEMLWLWHSSLFQDQQHISDLGKYRTHIDPMQIVSTRYDSPKIFFEAPPSEIIFGEMTKFIDWFNSSRETPSTLGRAAIAHVYFESIHPFEDGNGRIGRLLIEKILSQSVGKPVLIAVSKVLEKRKKEYYAGLEKCNRTLAVQDWVEFFSNAILQAQEESLNLLYFLVEKSKLLNALSGQINPRQEKVLLRMFAEGPAGFKGDLSAEKYIAITKTSRATATRDLTDLVQKKALVKTGELRHTRYRLNIPELI